MEGNRQVADIDPSDAASGSRTSSKGGVRMSFRSTPLAETWESTRDDPDSRRLTVPSACLPLLGGVVGRDLLGIRDPGGHAGLDTSELVALVLNFHPQLRNSILEFRNLLQESPLVHLVALTLLFKPCDLARPGKGLAGTTYRAWSLGAFTEDVVNVLMATQGDAASVACVIPVVGYPRSAVTHVIEGRIGHASIVGRGVQCRTLLRYGAVRTQQAPSPTWRSRARR